MFKNYSWTFFTNSDYWYVYIMLCIIHELSWIIMLVCEHSWISSSGEGSTVHWNIKWIELTTDWLSQNAITHIVHKYMYIKN